MRINTNLQSIAAQRSLSKNTSNLLDSARKLSSGSRITRAADDAAGLSISEGLKSDLRANRVAKRNAEDATSVIQVAEGGLNEVGNILNRLKELSIQGASDTIGDTEREFIDNEAQSLISEIDRIAGSTKYAGKTLLDGSAGTLQYQVGTDSSASSRISHDLSGDSTSAGLKVDGLDFSSKAGALDAIQSIEDAVGSVGQMRSSLGAVQNRLTSTIDNLDVSHENLSAANSRIRDVDVAEETANLTKYQVLQQLSTSILAQANQSSASALALL